jgi:hypothetical protein
MSTAVSAISRKKVYLCFVGYDKRMFPYVEHIAWAARQIPTMHVAVS